MKITYTAMLTIGFTFILYSGGIFTYQGMSTKNTSSYITLVQKIPDNQRLTKDAWELHHSHQWNLAIEKADSCIEMFRGQAEISQEKLIREKIPVPELPVNKDAQEEILARGLLNDVATCYYIKGVCYKAKRDTTNAIAAFSGAMSFPHAFCWDPGGWLWNIKEASEGKLRQLKKG